MLGVQNHQHQKERILSLMASRGPSLPVHIARGIGVEPLFAGAFLSELYAEKKIKISNMRVGGSPLYYIEGQEEQLEKFIEHLNGKEREAFIFLKREKVLEDDSLAPVVRVALRAIKDFAIPVKIKIENDDKLYWRYFLLPDPEMRGMIQNRLMPVERKALEKKEGAQEQKTEVKIEDKKEIEHLEEKKEEKEEVSVKEKGEVEENNGEKEEISVGGEKEEGKKAKTGEIIKALTKEKQAKEFEFGKGIKDYLSNRDLEILGVLLDKKKEFIAKIRADSLFGKQEFLLVAKDKKSVNDNDLTMALQRAQLEKMPALFMSAGELNKKGIEYLKDWKNLIKFEKAKI